MYKYSGNDYRTINLTKGTFSVIYPTLLYKLFSNIFAWKLMWTCFWLVPVFILKPMVTSVPMVVMLARSIYLDPDGQQILIKTTNLPLLNYVVFRKDIRSIKILKGDELGQFLTG